MKAKVSIVECDSYDTELVYNSIKRSLDDIGFKFKKGAKVLIKPNVLSDNLPDKHVTTHPAMVDAMCRILKENKCKIKIGESSGNFGTSNALKVAGITGVAEKYGAELKPFESSKLVKVKLSGIILKETYFAKDVLDADLVINMPKLKTHALTKFTCCVKNPFGTMPGAYKHKMHILAPDEQNFSQLLLDRYEYFKPGLNIVDAIIGLEGEGPSAGTPKKTGMIVAGTDAVATDIICQKIIGLDPNEVFTTKYAIERGFFSGIDDIELIGTLKVVKYKLPVTVSKAPKFLRILFHKSMIAKPVSNEELCTKCGICRKVCPVQSISYAPYPVFDRSKCINCYCCFEMCPHKAIDLKGSMIVRLASSIREVFR